MIQRVPQEVIERSLESFQDVPVDWGGLTRDLKPHCLAERAGDITHHPMKSLNTIRKRPHTAVQHFVIQTRGKTYESTMKQLKI